MENFGKVRKKFHETWKCLRVYLEKFSEILSYHMSGNTADGNKMAYFLLVYYSDILKLQVLITGHAFLIGLVWRR